MSEDALTYSLLCNTYVESLEKIHQQSHLAQYYTSEFLSHHNLENSLSNRAAFYKQDLLEQAFLLFINTPESTHNSRVLSDIYKSLQPTPVHPSTTRVKMLAKNLETQEDLYFDLCARESKFAAEEIANKAPLSDFAILAIGAASASDKDRALLGQILASFWFKAALDFKDSTDIPETDKKVLFRRFDRRLATLTEQMVLHELESFTPQRAYRETYRRFVSPTTQSSSDIMRTLPTQKFSAQEQALLVQNTPEKLSPSRQIITPRLTELLQELDDKIGLEDVKKVIHDTVNTLIIQQERVKRGKKNPPLSLHMAFTGNPGTGKTTIARLVGDIFKELNLLSKGHFTEARRSDLTDGFIGQTEAKTRGLLDKASGGILFIDEIQSMIPSGDKDFAREANTEIVAAMENNREDLVVIIAGYPDKVEEYIKCDAGFNDRFAIRIHFPDYQNNDLKQIFAQMLQEEDFTLNAKSLEALDDILNWEKARSQDNFGNARFMRTLRDFTIRAQHNRLRQEQENIASLSDQDLDLMTDKDLETALLEIQKQRRSDPPSGQKKQDFIGFIDPKNKPSQRKNPTLKP